MLYLCLLLKPKDMMHPYTETKPRIELVPSALDKTLETLGKLFLFVMLALTVYTFIKSPSTVPTHFNAAGQADDYGNKAAVLILPAIGVVIYFVMTVLSRKPHLFNYMTKITVENAQQQYSTAARMIRFVKLAILALFTFIILFTYLTSIGAVKGLGGWFLPLTLLLLLGPTAFLIIQSARAANKKS